MNDDKYRYFGYSTRITSDKELKKLMEEGVVSKEGNYLPNIALPFNDSRCALKHEDYIKGLAKEDKNAVVIIKLPLEYIYPEIEDDMPKEIPIPIWKEIKGKRGKSTSILDSNYIYRIYFPFENRYISNPNYSPVNDPVGKKYDSLQLFMFEEYFATELFTFGIERMNKTYEELCEFVLSRGLWDDVVERLNKKYHNVDDVSLKLKKDKDN